MPAQYYFNGRIKSKRTILLLCFCFFHPLNQLYTNCSCRTALDCLCILTCQTQNFKAGKKLGDSLVSLFLQQKMFSCSCTLIQKLNINFHLKNNFEKFSQFLSVHNLPHSRVRTGSQNPRLSFVSYSGFPYTDSHPVYRLPSPNLRLENLVFLSFTFPLRVYVLFSPATRVSLKQKRMTKEKEKEGKYVYLLFLFMYCLYKLLEFLVGSSI